MLVLDGEDFEASNRHTAEPKASISAFGFLLGLCQCFGYHDHRWANESLLHSVPALDFICNRAGRNRVRFQMLNRFMDARIERFTNGRDAFDAEAGQGVHEL